MQWKAPSERTQIILLSPIIIPAMAIFVPVVLIGIALPDYLWRKFGPEPKRGWHDWFAWRPVKCDGFFYDAPDKWVLLETVQRRYPWPHRYRLREWTTPLPPQT